MELLGSSQTGVWSILLRRARHSRPSIYLRLGVILRDCEGERAWPRLNCDPAAQGAARGPSMIGAAVDVLFFDREPEPAMRRDLA